MIVRLARFIFLLPVFFLVSGAQAAQVTYIFSGEITEILDSNNFTTGLVSTSSTFTGRMTWDTENYSFFVPGSIPAYRHYIDFGENFSMSLTIDGNVGFDPMVGVGVTVANDESITLNDPLLQDWGGDGLYIESTSLRGNPASPDTWDLPLSEIDWWMQFRYHSLNFDTWDTLDLPEQLPIADFLNQYIRISAGDLTDFGWLQGEGYQITGRITGYQLFQPVPVPAAVWLFGSALGMLAWVRRRFVQ